jgi:hypothetical protein
MQRCAHELLDETPVGVASAIAPVGIVFGSDLFVVVDVLGLRSLSLIGLLISPGCG